MQIDNGEQKNSRIPGNGKSPWLGVPRTCTRIIYIIRMHQTDLS